MSTVGQFVKLKRLVADWLLALSCGYLGLSVLGPLWFPYDALIAALVAFAAWWFGDFRYRWWPIAAVRDQDHELHVERKTPSEKP
jgi:hypothetical protein